MKLLIPIGAALEGDLLVVEDASQLAKSGTHREATTDELRSLLEKLLNDSAKSKLEQAILEVTEELKFATREFGPFASVHEAYGVIAEEYRELEEHVFANHRRRDIPAMRAEACQLSAMALRLMVDLC